MNEVVIEVRGGIAEATKWPKWLRVIIRDYDMEGVDAERCTKDPDGVNCVESVYE